MMLFKAKVPTFPDLSQPTWEGAESQTPNLPTSLYREVGVGRQGISQPGEVRRAHRPSLRSVTDPIGVISYLVAFSQSGWAHQFTANRPKP